MTTKWSMKSIGNALVVLGVIVFFGAIALGGYGFSVASDAQDNEPVFNPDSDVPFPMAVVHHIDTPFPIARVQQIATPFPIADG